MAVVYTASPELRFRGFWQDDSAGLAGNRETKERELDYLVKFSTYSSVERVKALLRFGWGAQTWYSYESVCDRRGIFYRSPWLEKSDLATFKWKIISPACLPIRRLFLVCSAFRRGRRLEGKIRLDFELARANRPILILDGERPSWSAKRHLLLNRVMGSLSDPSVSYRRF